MQQEIMSLILMKLLDLLMMRKSYSENLEQDYMTYLLKHIQAMYTLSYIRMEH